MDGTYNIVAVCAGAGAGAAVALALLAFSARDAIEGVRGRKGARVGGRAAVRLALRMAQQGQHALLVDSPSGVRLARPEEAAGSGLHYVGALGSLTLARQR